MAGRSSAFFAPLRVFLIESDADLRDRIERELRRDGFLDIVALPNVATALYLLERLGCDLLIAEFGPDWLKLLDYLTPIRDAETFVVAVAAAASIADMSSNGSMRTDRVLAKPVASADLASVVAAFRASRSTRDRLPHGDAFSTESALPAQS